MKRFAPERIAAWRTDGSDQGFGPKSIYSYLNGGAEVYLDYGLKRLFVRQYARAGWPRLSLLIFDMGRAEEAYGIFSHEREGKSVEVGQDSDLATGLLRFWQGRYFVSVTAIAAPGASTAAVATIQRAMVSLGREVGTRLPGPGKRPELLGLLPQRGIDPGSVRYLHTHATLGHHLSLPPKNSLGLDRRTEVVLAEYPYKRDRLVALVVAFEDPRQTRRAMAALASPEVARVLGPSQARACGRILAAVVGPGPSARRGTLLERVCVEIPGCPAKRGKKR